ncbi:MAG: O-antigen ligase family protein [Desulfobacterales bacterium]|nr:O-antigen ligase family protein [Desulfobacterales bacterium]
MVIIPGERAKVFSGLLCAVFLIVALFASRKEILHRHASAARVSIILVSLVILSGLFSITPASSSARGFVILTSALGGFWGARLLLNTRARLVFFQWFCLVILVGVMILTVAGIANSGKIYQYIDVHWHPVADRLILLSFAPLALITTGSRPLKYWGIFFLAACYIVLIMAGYFHGMESVIIFPPLCLVLAAAFRKWSFKELCILLIILALMFPVLSSHLKKHSTTYDKGFISIAYRIENIYFSWHLARLNPFLGIGLWAPRDTYLADYETKYPYASKETFTRWTHELRTSENSVLTFMADLGFPFIIIYSSAVILLLWKLVRAAIRKPPDMPYHPLVLLLPVVGAILHYQFFDGLFHPQISWFFHILLGLIPTAQGKHSVNPLLSGKGSSSTNGRSIEKGRLFINRLSSRNSLRRGGDSESISISCRSCFKFRFCRHGCGSGSATPFGIRKPLSRSNLKRTEFTETLLRK